MRAPPEEAGGARAVALVDRPWTVAVAFLIVGGVFGLALVVVSPPLRWGDENTHFLHAYRLSEIQLALVPLEQDGMGALLPRGVAQLQIALALDRLVEQRAGDPVSARRVRERRAIVASASDRRVVQILSSNYPPLGYVAPAIGIAVARCLTSSALLQLYGARLANLLAWLAVVAAAIRLAPALRLPLAVLALSPMSVFLAATCDADATANALAFLWSAAIVRLALGRVLPQGSAIALVVLGAALAVVKLLYGPLLFLLLAVPARRLGGPAARRKLLAGVLAAAAACAALWLVVGRWQIWRGATYRGADAIRASVDLLAGDPLHAAGLVAQSLFRPGAGAWPFHLVDTLWGVVAPDAVLWLWLAAVATAIVADARATSWPEGRSRAVALVVAGATLAAVAVVALVLWTPADADGLAGFQGRYAIPVLPALLLAVLPRRGRRPASPRTRTALCTTALALSAALLAYTVLRGIRLYG